MTTGGMKLPGPSNLVQFPGKTRTLAAGRAPLSRTALFLREEMRRRGPQTAGAFAEDVGTSERSVRRIRSKRSDDWWALLMLDRLAEAEARASRAELALGQREAA